LSNERALNEAFIKSAICGMVEVTHSNQGYEVTLPQAYHTGHAVCVIVRPEKNGYLIHDNSYAAMLLSDHGVRVGKKLHQRFAPMVDSYGCSLEGFRVGRTCDSADHVALAMALVGCASRLIADYLLESTPQPLFDFRASLLGKVTSIVGERRVRTNQDVTGQYGAHYKVSTVILDDRESRPVAFVEPVSDRDAVSRRFKEFYDIMHNPVFEDVERVSVLQDRNEIAAGDSLLLQEVSSLVRFADVPKRLEAWRTVQ
jgi:hypothetical protein